MDGLSRQLEDIMQIQNTDISILRKKIIVALKSSLDIFHGFIERKEVTKCHICKVRVAIC